MTKVLTVLPISRKASALTDLAALKSAVIMIALLVMFFFLVSWIWLILNSSFVAKFSGSIPVQLPTNGLLVSTRLSSNAGSVHARHARILLWSVWWLPARRWRRRWWIWVSVQFYYLFVKVIVVGKNGIQLSLKCFRSEFALRGYFCYLWSSLQFWMIRIQYFADVKACPVGDECDVCNELWRGQAIGERFKTMPDMELKLVTLAPRPRTQDFLAPA